MLKLVDLDITEYESTNLVEKMQLYFSSKCPLHHVAGHPSFSTVALLTHYIVIHVTNTEYTKHELHLLFP